MMTKNTQITDEQLRSLIRQIRCGEQTAYKTLLNQLTPVLRRLVVIYATRWNVREYAEDIIQESLLAIHLKLHTYDINLPFLAWVNTVAKHKLIDHIRRHKTQHVSIDEEGIPELSVPGNHDASGATTDLLKLLKQLKPPADEIIYAMKVDGASLKEIAETYQLSEANVKVIVHRGLQKLADMVRNR